MTKDQVGRRLTDITLELRGLFTERAQVDSTERQAFSERYFSCEETSLEARKQQGYRASLEFTKEKIVLDGHILNLMEERDNLRFCVKYGMESQL